MSRSEQLIMLLFICLFHNKFYLCFLFMFQYITHLVCDFSILLLLYKHFRHAYQKLVHIN